MENIVLLRFLFFLSVWSLGLPWPHEIEKRQTECCACPTTTTTPTTTTPTTTTTTTTTTTQTPASAVPIFLGAFNAKILGKTKIYNPEVAPIIAMIVRRYDLILISEIRDKYENYVHDFLEMVNDINPADPYALNISASLGRTSYKEQYGYFYRLSTVEVVATHQYADPDDLFIREPFSVKARAIGTGTASDIGIMGIHTSPDFAVQEIRDLMVPFEELRDIVWQDVEDFIIMGDFNADCGVEESDLNGWPIYDPEDFLRLLDFDADTNVASTPCAYDRIVVAGQDIVDEYDPGSVAVFRFDVEYGLNEDETKAVSDHYPVEVRLHIIPH